MNIKKKIINGVIMAILLLSLGSRAYAVPTVDGIFSVSDGYTTGYDTTFTVQGGATNFSGGQLWVYQDPTTHDVYAALLQPKTLVDNTYGANSIGWDGSLSTFSTTSKQSSDGDKGDKGSSGDKGDKKDDKKDDKKGDKGATDPKGSKGKGHKFSDLTGSDMAEFQFKNGSGVVVLDVNLDYFSSKSSAPSGYGTLGVTGGDGKVNVGSASNVLAYGTSLDFNFNNLGCSSFTTDSPATNASYAPNPGCPGWVFDVEYEIKVSGSLFGPSGQYSLSIPLIHDSPNKSGDGNKVNTCDTFPSHDCPPIVPPPPDCSTNPNGPGCQPPVTVPEPSSLLLLASGLAGLGFWKRKQFKAELKSNSQPEPVL